MSMKEFGRAALLSGTLASLTSALALVVVARARGKGPLQPINATSHWLNGRPAAEVTGADWRHTGVGYATHHAATLFWALPFQAWLACCPGRRGGTAVLRDALVLSAVAAAVDYRATPKRFTPGWEFVLPRRGMALAYGAMAVGLAAGAALQSRPPTRR